MTERIIKLQSQQNYQEIAIAGAFTQKLVDFHIPASGLTYDLAKSYININMQVTNNGLTETGGVAPDGVLDTDSALFSNDLSLASSNARGNVRLSSNAAMVRNADMFSSNRGMVESIRRVNTLRAVLWNLENDSAEKHNGLDKIGVFQGRRGVNNKTTQMIQNTGSNVDAAGNIDAGLICSSISRDYRIPLSDLFGVGSSKWNSNYFGETRIHLELQPNNLFVEKLGGSEDTTIFQGRGQNAAYGAMVSYATAAPGLGELPVSIGLGTASAPLITTLTYTDPSLDFPFHVGQAVFVDITNGNTTAPVPVPSTAANIIESIEYVTAATVLRLAAATPPLANVKVGQVSITFRTAIITPAATVGPSSITAITIKAALSQDVGDKIQINRAELVLSELSEDGPLGMDYTTYSTEETQGQAGLLTLNQQVLIEPNCSNLIVANCATGKNFAERQWFQYRISIDNVDQSGNRDIIWGESLHKDRMERFFKNRSQRFTNSSLRAIACNPNQRVPLAAPAAGGNQVAIYPILETMPITENMKIVNLELEGTTGNAPEDVIFFKELQKSI